MPDATRLTKLYHLDAEALGLIRGYGKKLDLEEAIVHFYGWLPTQPEFERFFENQETVDHVKDQQLRYWHSFWNIERMDSAYVASRREVGAVHARIRLPLAVYYASMHQAHQIAMVDLYDNWLSPEEYVRTLHAVSSLMSLDVAVVGDCYEMHTRSVHTDMSQLILMMGEFRSVMEHVERSGLYKRVKEVLEEKD